MRCKGTNKIQNAKFKMQNFLLFPPFHLEIRTIFRETRQYANRNFNKFRSFTFCTYLTHWTIIICYFFTDSNTYNSQKAPIPKQKTARHNFLIIVSISIKSNTGNIIDAKLTNPNNNINSPIKKPINQTTDTIIPNTAALKDANLAGRNKILKIRCTSLYIL